jgi:flagellar hook-associated protein 2
MTISSAGIGSGLDVNSIVTQLMAIERQPLTALETKATTIQSTVSEYGKIKSAVSTLRDAAAKLASTSTWGQTVTNSSSTAVSATTNSSAAGSYTVEVQALASVQTIATASAVPATTTPGAGTLHIELGAYNATQTTFTPKVGATAVDIAITASDTLATVRDKINGAGAGVTALIMTDASGSRLLIRSNASGAANAFRTSGIASLAFDPTAGATAMTQSQKAGDAAATINGLAVTSASNTLSNIVDGLTLNLSTLTTAPVTVNVVTDTDSLKKTITDFAAAYSALVKLIATDTKYDPATKTGALLQGDSAAIGLQRQMRTLAGGSSGASAMFGHLSDVGLQLQGDGSMTVNDSKLANALGNVAELKKMFSNSNLLDASQDGFGKRFRAVTDSMLGIDGALTTKTDSLGKQLQRNHNDQDTLQTRLDGIEKRMRAQYTALDATMALLNSKSNYITQQIAAFNANSSSSK